MPNLTNRQEEILTAVIQLYVQTAEPVASKRLCGEVGFECSSATVRNEMAALEKAGYLTNTHTSSGRIPTDKGYRFFVNQHGRKDLSEEEQLNLQEEFLKLRAQYARMARITSKLLAQQGGSVGFSSIPQQGLSFESGLTNLLKSPDLSGSEELREAAEVLEQLDEHSEEVLHELEKQSGKIKVYIGQENPLFQMKHVSMILTNIHLYFATLFF
jgi:transcriptional regulator of heat shock response